MEQTKHKILKQREFEINKEYPIFQEEKIVE